MNVQRQLHFYGFKKVDNVFQLRGFHMNSKRSQIRQLKRKSPSRSLQNKEGAKLGTKKRKVKYR